MSQRRGLSLLELLASTAVLGVIAGTAFAIMRLDSLGNHGAMTVARTLANDLELARYRSINTGDDHFLLLTSSSSIVAYTLHRDTGGSSIAEDVTREIPGQVTVTISPAAGQTPSLTFEGLAASSFTFTVAGPQRTLEVTVTAATGRAVVTKM